MVQRIIMNIDSLNIETHVSKLYINYIPMCNREFKIRVVQMVVVIAYIN